MNKMEFNRPNAFRNVQALTLYFESQADFDILLLGLRCPLYMRGYK